ncbi:MAG: hypothetical protein M3546_15880 [Actinomycetota bacterium]|nr:hypothetical protein [Actinomycetota bacterium]
MARPATAVKPAIVSLSLPAPIGSVWVIAPPGPTGLAIASLNVTANVSPASRRFADPSVRDEIRQRGSSRDFEVDRVAFMTVEPGEPRRHASARLSLKADRFFQATCAVALFTVIVTVALWWIP